MLRVLVLTLSVLLPVSLAGGLQSASAQAPVGSPVAAAIERPPPPYDARLLRLAEILGSVQYLRNLCNPEGETNWRDGMQALLDSETAEEPNRREILTAGYNRGFRSFAAVYSSCTNAANVAEQRYRREGATLVSEIVARYGN